MVRIEPSVNSRVCHRPGPASVIHNAEADSDDQSALVGLPTQRNKRFVCRCTIHSTVSAVLLLPRTALKSQHRSRRLRPAKAPFIEPGLSGSVAIFAQEMDMRVLRALRSPATTGKEAGAMATVFARPKLQLFGVSTAFVVRRIGLSDLGDALRLGWEDFKAIPTHAVVLCVIYPVLGLVLFRLVVGYSVLPLLFPLAAGFTLIGPFAALGLYELSRRRERGEEAAAWHAMEVLRAPSFGAILGLGMFLFVLFGVWIATADAIYIATFGNAPAATIPDFARRVLTTP